MLNQLKPYIEKVVNKIARGLPRFSPHFITVAGLIPPVLFFWFLTHGRIGWALICAIGTLFDSLDGAYARATNQVSEFGALLDSTVDRISDAVIISAFGFAGLVNWELVIAVLIVSFLISYVRGRGESLLKNARVLAVGPIERAERLAIIFLGLIIFSLYKLPIADSNVINLTFLLLLALSVVTVYRRITAASRGLAKQKK